MGLGLHGHGFNRYDDCGVAVKVGDLVNWPQGYCDNPGLVLEMRPTRGAKTITSTMNPTGMAALVMLPELGNDPEWFHECELEVISESR